MDAAAAPTDSIEARAEITATSSSEGLRFINRLRRFCSKTFNALLGKKKTAPGRVGQKLTIEGLVTQWREHGFENIITLAGSGISRGAGLPDFRMPSEALDRCLRKYELPNGSSLFERKFFEQNPEPLYAVTRDLNVAFVPTLSHYFIRLLHEKGVLLRHYTQNIDPLDSLAGLPPWKVVTRHGVTNTNHCMQCSKFYPVEWMEKQLSAKQCPICDYCQGTVKPDIVFDDEPAPAAFNSCPLVDFDDCDLLIVLGVPLNAEAAQPQPFSSLIERCGPRCPRLFIHPDRSQDPTLQHRFAIDPTRDVVYNEECDAAVLQLAAAIGWDDELQVLGQYERNREELLRSV